MHRSIGEAKIGSVRTYSHALLTWTVARRLNPSDPGVAAAGAAGALIPDLPAIAGAFWLGAKRRRWFDRREFCEEACEKGPFGGPDAALHSALPVAALLALYAAPGVKERDPRGRSPAFLLGWVGHALADVLTHVEDARPIFWPISRRRFRGPISYWDHAHHARSFTLAEHAALLVVAARLLSHNPPG